MKYLTRNEIAIDKKYKDKIPALVETLMDAGYVCMLSYEDDLIIINYVITLNGCSDRNEVCFIEREIMELQMMENS